MGASIGLAGTRGDDSTAPAGLRPILTAFLDSLPTGTGVLITLDELHHLRRDEVIELAVTAQHLIREGREFMLVLAGIPSSIRPLLSSDEGKNPITFLRRANTISLGRVAGQFVREGLDVPVREVGMKWEKEALDEATAACGGYPFMIQLVGQWAYRNAGDDVISLEAARRGIDTAKRKLGSLVHKPAVDDLSHVDRTFLLAMALDDGPSSIGEIASRLNISSQYANNYRRRLLEAQMIEQAGHGKLDFALPYLRDYLRDHAAIGQLDLN